MSELRLFWGSSNSEKKAQVNELLEHLSNGRFFTATFIKNDGTKRIMTCRMGVKKYTNGRGMKYSPRAYELQPVYDLAKEDYRMLNMKHVISIKANKKHYLFDHEAELCKG